MQTGRRIKPGVALILYLVGSPVLLWMASMVSAAFGLPGWFFPLAVGLVLVGLPIVVVTAVCEARGPVYFADGPGVADPDPTPIDEERRRRARLPHDGETWSGVKSLFTWRNTVGGGVVVGTLWFILALGWFLMWRQQG